MCLVLKAHEEQLHDVYDYIRAFESKTVDPPKHIDLETWLSALRAMKVRLVMAKGMVNFSAPYSSSPDPPICLASADSLCV